MALKCVRKEQRSQCVALASEATERPRTRASRPGAPPAVDTVIRCFPLADSFPHFDGIDQFLVFELPQVPVLLHVFVVVADFVQRKKRTARWPCP